MSLQSLLHDALSIGLNPEILLIENESKNHNVPINSETHFKITAVSTAFANLTRIERHRMVYKLIDKEFTGALHALSLSLYTPLEWKNGMRAPVSPPCQHR